MVLEILIASGLAAAGVLGVNYLEQDSKSDTPVISKTEKQEPKLYQFDSSSIQLKPVKFVVPDEELRPVWELKTSSESGTAPEPEQDEINDTAVQPVEESKKPSVIEATKNQDGSYDIFQSVGFEKIEDFETWAK